MTDNISTYDEKSRAGRTAFFGLAISPKRTTFGLFLRIFFRL